MKNNRRNIIECCNNTQQGRHVPANKLALALQTSLTLVTLVVSLCAQNGEQDPLRYVLPWPALLL